MKVWAAAYLIFLFVVAANAQGPTPTPMPIREEVVVTANKVETRLTDTPASVVTMDRSDIEAAAAPAVDDILRQTAGFSLFRRSTSRNANPTTQGVSLRGVGASGASRSVVLFDGVPLNDPFGGWVQWGRVVPIAVETIEVLRGGASDLYGDAGLSGAISIIPRNAAEKLAFSADLFGGTQGTFSGSGFAGFRSVAWRGDITASSFQTRGYRPVDEAVQGPVDGRAGVRSSNFAVTVKREIGKRASVFVRPTYFGEVRTNGTGLQTNRTHISQATFGGDVRFAKTGNINWRLISGSQVYDQIFSTVNAPRTAESLNRVQRVPAQVLGFSAQFSTVIRSQTLLAGVELRNVRGASDEIAVASGLPTNVSGAGGREHTSGIFIEDFARVGSRLVLAGSIRYDRWRNYDAANETHFLATDLTLVTVFPTRTEDALSPRFAVLHHVSDTVSLYANASRSFRSPTLNELYRAFRVGNVLTQANENLRAERATGFEGGVSLQRKGSRLRASGFWTDINETIANVTIATTQNLITRQRQNAGQTRSRGFEIEAETRLRIFNIRAGYLFADSNVTRFPTNTQLIGLEIPQVPRHQFTFQALCSPGKWTLALQARASGQQFDDDLNQFRLEPYFQSDLFASRRVSEHMQIYAAVENVLNSRYSIGKTPIRTVSAPVSLRVGIRWK